MQNNQPPDTALETAMQSIESSLSHHEEKRRRVWNINDILTAEFPKEQWLVKDLISLPGLTALSGDPGSGKTWLTIHLALSLSTGSPFLGEFDVTPTKTLVIDEEDHIQHIQKRLRALGATEQADLHYISQESIDVGNKDDFVFLEEEVDRLEIGLVIFDSLSRIHSGDENDAQAINKVMDQFKKLTKRNVSVLFTAHHRKSAPFSPRNSSQNLRGSTAIWGALDCHIAVEKRGETMTLRNLKSRTGVLHAPFDVLIRDTDNSSVEILYTGEHEGRKPKKQIAIEAIQSVLSDGIVLNREELVERLSDVAGKQAVADAVKAMIADDSIERVPSSELHSGDSRKHHYRLSNSTSQLLDTI